MIHATGLVARSRTPPRVEVGPVSFSVDAGSSHALVGAPSDGVELLLAVLAGSARARSGTVQIAGAPAGPRRKLAYAPYEPVLPTVMTVAEHLALASRIRGEPFTPAADRLAVLGVSPLAMRRISSLGLEESRTVALVEALTSRADVLLLAEPLADVDPRAVGRLAGALEARVDAGATVVVTTASREDARALGRAWLFFERGKLTRRATAADPWSPPTGPRGARLFIRSEGARFLLAELSPDPTFASIQGEGAALVVTGSDPVAMANAVAGASRRANVEIDVLRFEAPEADG